MKSYTGYSIAANFNSSVSEKHGCSAAPGACLLRSDGGSDTTKLLQSIDMMFASDPLSTPTLDPASTDPVEDCWSFLAELDAGLDPAVLLNKSQDIDTVSTNTQLQQNHDAVPVSTESMQKLTALERKQEKNRLAQKRFRQRKKVRLAFLGAARAHVGSWSVSTPFKYLPGGPCS